MKKCVSFSGRLLTVLSGMMIYSVKIRRKDHETLSDQIALMLKQAQQCMQNAGSITGQATVQFTLGKLK